MKAGVATHRVASSRFPELIEALCNGVPVDAILGAFAEPSGKGAVTTHQAAVDRLFHRDRVEELLAALDAEVAESGVDAAFAFHAAALIRTKSPTSLKIALAQMRRGSMLDFAECMRTEFRIVSRVMRGHDFYEGVRAVIIDKDQAPLWRPPVLEAVSDTEVEGCFAPLASELQLPELELPEA